MSSAARLATAIALLIGLVAAIAGAAKPAADPTAALAAVQARLDADDPAGALRLLAPLLKRDPKLARGYLQRATARLMLGEPGGKEDLDKAIALEPSLRAAVMQRAGLAMVEQRYADALADFQRARGLDPADADTILNVGAAELLLGRLDAASRSFQEFLGRRPNDAAAYYLVAKNYALAGYAGLALQHVQQAIALDERVRARIRADANFAELSRNPRFQELMSVDSYRPPAGARQVQRRYAGAYAAGSGPLLPATMDALGALGEPFENVVERTPDFALLWGTFRIKLEDAADGQGVVTLALREGAMSDADWSARTDRLLDEIFLRLAKRQARRQAQPVPTPQP